MPLQTSRHGRLAALALLACLLPVTAATQPLQVRPAAVAGSWYPDDPRELGALLDRLLASAPAVTDAPAPEQIRALISPHAGYRYSGPTAAAGYALLQGRRVQRVIVIGPAHHHAFQGLSIPEAGFYETPLGRIAVDTAASERLRSSPLVHAVDAAHEREHSIEMQLPLLQRVLEPGWQLLPVLVGTLRDADYRPAAGLLRALADESTLVVVSSDFTHYGRRFGFLPFPPDAQVRQRLERLDMGLYAHIAAHDAAGLVRARDAGGHTVCGYRAIALLLEMLPADATTWLADYSTSGALGGDYRESVSYLSILVTSERPLALRTQPDAGS